MLDTPPTADVEVTSVGADSQRLAPTLGDTLRNGLTHTQLSPHNSRLHASIQDSSIATRIYIFAPHSFGRPLETLTGPFS